MNAEAFPANATIVDENMDLLNTLLEEGRLDVNSKSECSRLFYLAYTNGHKDFVRKLLEKGLDVDCEMVKDLPCVEDSHLHCLAELLWFKVYQNTMKNCSKQTKSMLKAARIKDYESLYKYLLKDCSTKACKKDEKCCKIFSALLFLLVYDKECRLDLIQALVDQGADVGASFYGHSVSTYATLCCNAQGLAKLVENNCAVNEMIHNGSYSPFHYAIQLSSVDCLEILLSSKDLMSFKSWQGNGFKLISFAIKRKQDECVKKLLEFGATVNRPESGEGSEDDSPLIIAIKHKNVKVIDLLLQHNVDINQGNSCRETPLMHAIRKGLDSCVDRLISLGADVNAVDCENESALMHAVQSNQSYLVNCLLEAGADISTENIHKYVALSYAVAHKHTDCLEMILSSKQFHSSRLVLSACHKDAFLYALGQMNVKALLLLIQHGLFAWEWLDGVRPVPTEILARVLVASGFPPGHFQMRFRTTTLFQAALETHDMWTAYYLLANLYLIQQDLVHLRYDKRFLKCLRRRGNQNILHLLDTMVCQPLCLQSICIVTLSSSLGIRQSRERKEAVKTLPIPDTFKSVLKFQGVYASICVGKWKEIGKVLKERDPCKPLIDFFQLRENLEHCEKLDDCDCDSAASYRIRFDLFKKRMQSLDVLPL